MKSVLKPINKLSNWSMSDIVNVGHISPWMVKAGFGLIHAVVYSEIAGTPPMEGLTAISGAFLADIAKRWGFELKEVQHALGDLMDASYLVPDYDCKSVTAAVIGGDFAQRMMDRLNKENRND